MKIPTPTPPAADAERVCRTCRFWKKEPDGFHKCNFDRPDGQGLRVLGGVFWPEENFGCIHHDLVPLPAEPVAGESLEAAISILRYRVGNPSAWDHYDENASEDIRRLLDLLGSWTPPRPGEGEKVDQPRIRKLIDWLQTTNPCGMSYQEDAANLIEQLAEVIHSFTVANKELWERIDAREEPLASAAREWWIPTVNGQNSGSEARSGRYLMAFESESAALDSARHWIETDRAYGDSSPKEAGALRVREVHPVTPQVRTVPEGLPYLPAQFEYWGSHETAVVADQGGDVALLINGKWEIGAWTNNHGKPGTHAAIRRGTELHRRNFTP